MKKAILITTTCFAGLFQSCGSNTTSTQTNPTKSNEFLHSSKGIIDKSNTNEAYKELKLQEATQSYLWAFPLVSFVQWQFAHVNTFGAKSGDIVLYQGYDGVKKIITGNVTTPYIISFLDLGTDGAYIIELPAGNVAGGLGTMWQSEIAVLGEMGESKGKSAKYLITPPEGKDKDLKLAGYNVIKSSMNNVFLGLRVLDPDPKLTESITGTIKIYPYSKRNNPPKIKIVKAADYKQDYLLGPPEGVDYWKRLHESIQKEPVEERNMFYMAFLRDLGIEKGKPFNPTPEEKQALLDGEKRGVPIIQAITYDKKIENSKHWSDRNWDYVINIPNAKQRSDSFEYLWERTAYYYEAVSFSAAMISKTPGQGQAYLGTYTDKNGQWLDGSKDYALNIPANAPAANFWSLTVYDSETRCIIDNDQRNADLSSRKDLQKNADGSVDLYFGPKPPAGKESNWVQTVPNKHWFAYLRLYGPTEDYFNKSWKMGDIEIRK